MSRPPKQSQWRIVVRQYRRSRVGLIALVVIVCLGGVALGASFIAGERPIYLRMNGQTWWLVNCIDYPEFVNFDFTAWQPKGDDYAILPVVPYAPDRSSLRDRLQAPSAAHWLGTDDRGRDVLSRMVWGTRIAMTIGFVAVGISVVIGLIMGSLAGYFGGIVDIIIMRIIEVVMCFPTFFLILALLAYLRPSIYNIMVAIGIVGWTGIARLVRGNFLKLREMDYATAARATGLTDARIMFRHILPNAVAPVFVSATFGVAGAILAESGLSFLGFGVPPPTASWGEVLSQSQRFITQAWWLVVFPGAAIFVTVTAFNLIGQTLRDAMDPRLRQ